MRFGNCVQLLVLTLMAVPPVWSQGNPKLDVLAGGDRALRVVSSDLLQARQAVARGVPVAEAWRENVPQAVRGEKVECIFSVSEVTPGLLRAVEASGLELVGTYRLPGVNHVVVRALYPEQLLGPARRPGVRAVMAQPAAWTWTGSVENQADISINADDVRNLLGFDGTGVRIGVLSDTVHRVIGGTLSGGFLTGSASQLSGDLPASIRVLDAGPASGGDEGAAMMELMYDLAPGVDFSFASGSSGYPQFALNIAALRTDTGLECDVIVDDVYYFVEPMYQDGPIALAARDAVTGGVSYFSSAGNSGDDGHERTYVDINPSSDDTAYPASGDDLHDFGAAMGVGSDTHLEVSLQPGALLAVTLHWDEPYGGGFATGPGAEADLDLYVTSDTAVPLVKTPPVSSNVLAESTNLQGVIGSPFGDAVETLQYTNGTGSPQTVYLVVDHVDGREAGLTLHLWVALRGGGTIVDKALLADRTIFGHTAADGVTSVAAMFYGEIDTGGNVTAPSGVLNVEPFSSLGGNLPFWFSDDGLTRFSTPVLRFKPELTAPDGSNTTFFGSDIGYDADTDPNFFGTSAAAPHAAAAAALLLEADPGLTPGQVSNQLRSTAVDAETAGLDALSGDGVVDAYGAIQPPDVPEGMVY